MKTLTTLLTVLSMACGGEAGSDAALDVRVAIPEPEAGVFDLVTPEVEIPAGQERMYCWHIDHDGPTLNVQELVTHQGRYGHHLVILSTTDPQPHGTLEDCTDTSEMDKYTTLVLPDTRLPEGHAVEIPTGAHFVFQFHYVNVHERPIRVRDVARFHTLDADRVTRWASTLAANSLAFSVAPGEVGEEVFDCEIPADVDLLLMGGHMHEEGKEIEISYGPVDAPESLYRVDNWRPDYRDAPPVTLMLEEPKPLIAGHVIRTRCVWRNGRDHALEFPEEMCAAFGYVAGTKDPILCSVD